MAATVPTAEEAYAAWAPYYDDFMAHPAYPDWVRRLEALASNCGPRGQRALDVGCGTGKSTQPLLELGYSVTGCDPSPDMLDQARGRLGDDVELVRAKLPDLPRLGTFDYISCVNDVVNYLLGYEQLVAGFRALRLNLAPAGVLVFDASTQALYRSYYAGLRWREVSGAALLWRGETPPDFTAGGLAMATVEIFAADGGIWRRFSSRHVQRHHPDAVVRAALGDAGMLVEAVYGQHDDGILEQPLAPDSHTKAVYVATPSA